MDPKAQALAMFSKLIDMALAKSVGMPKQQPMAEGGGVPPEAMGEAEESKSGEEEIDPELMAKLLGGD